jgi:nucleoside-diphosphate kinase
MEKTLVLLKPDCVERRLVGTLIQRFEQKGLQLIGMKLLQAPRQLAEAHYAMHKARSFYPTLLNFITSGPTVALVLQGREAVRVVRELMGPTDGVEAKPGTIRGDFGMSKQNNIIHGSDVPENAEIEIGLWFKPEELVNYQMADMSWVLGS